MIRKNLKLFSLLSFFLIMLSCASDGDVVNVYSGRHYQSDEDLFREFERQTGIRVNLVKADTDQLINRLEMEGANSPADLFITADAGRMIQSKQKGLLQTMDLQKISDIVPEIYRDPEGYWTGFTKRVRVIVYHKERVDPSQLSTYEDLAHEKWKGKLLVRTSQNQYNQTLMASIIAANGEEKALEWARGVVGNMAQSPRGNDRDQIKAIVAGVGDIAIANTYYLGLLLNSTNAEERNVAQQVGIFFPNQQERGSHVNLSGIAITAHAPNRDNAQKLVEFLLGEQAQQVFVSENYEYPVSDHVVWSALLKDWGTFRSDPVPVERLGQYLQPGMIIFNQAGWN
jgi:iron(III) transport system substrate-binding protein